MRALTKKEEQQLIDGIMTAPITKFGIDVQIGNTMFHFGGTPKPEDADEYRTNLAIFIHSRARKSATSPIPKPLSRHDILQGLLVFLKDKLWRENELIEFAHQCKKFDNEFKYHQYDFNEMDWNKYKKAYDRQVKIICGLSKELGFGNDVPRKGLGQDILWCLRMIPQSWRDKNKTK